MKVLLVSQYVQCNIALLIVLVKLLLLVHHSEYGSCKHGFFQRIFSCLIQKLDIFVIKYTWLDYKCKLTSQKL